VGRAHKDRYLATSAVAARRRAVHLEAAVAAHHEAWQEDTTRVWHGINVPALLNRAALDGVSLNAFPHPKMAANRLAAEIDAVVGEPSDGTSVFDMATAMEPNVALNRFEGFM
jgi:hypothetical protein